MRSLALCCVLLSASACNLRPPCNPADELDAIEAGEPTCTELRAQRRRESRAALGASLAAMGESVEKGMAPQTKYYTVTVGYRTVHCREDSQGNVDCQ